MASLVAVLCLSFGLMGGAVVSHNLRSDGESGWATLQQEQAQQHEDEEEMSVAQMLCSGFSTPQVAVCLHGAARSFPHPLVHLSQKENLVEALGADTTTFIHLTRKDARADTREGKGGLFEEASREEIQAAAQELGVPAERMRILDGPNAPLPECESYQRHFQKKPAKNERGTVDYLYSLAGQLTHREGCMKLIREEEAQTNRSFDMVILARADLTVYQAMRPFCMYNTSIPRRFWDWMYMAPRADAIALFTNPHDQFYACQNTLNPLGSVEEFLDSAWKVGKVSPVSDESLPVMLTRLDKKNMPNVNICTRFKNRGALDADPGPEKLCRAMTYRNRFNAPD